MTTTHRPVSFFAGDDWFFRFRLTNALEQPYNLNNVQVLWLLHNPFGEIVIHDYLVRPINATNGIVQVWLPNDVTSNFRGGVYTDFVRINCEGIISTLATGPIVVTEDPWRAAISDDQRIVARNATENVVVMLDTKERITRLPGTVVPFRKRSA